MFIFSRWADLNNPLWLAPGWWFWDSWLFHGITWFIDFLWLLGVAVVLAIKLFFTLLRVFWALLTLIFWSIAGVINFYVSLWLLDINIDLTFFGPLLFFFGTFLWWLFWPEISCFIENIVWPYFQQILVFTNIAFRAILLIYNVVQRLWAEIVPVLGMIIYVVVELVVTFARLVVQLLGELDVYALLNQIFEVILPMSEIMLGALQAIVESPSIRLDELVVVVGPLVSIMVDSAPIIFSVVFWLIRILFAILPPLLTLLVKVIKFVQSHFFLMAMAKRVLLSADWEQADQEVFGPRARTVNKGPAAYSTADDYDQDIFTSVGHRTIKFWDQESLSYAEKHLSTITDWHQSNPPHTFNYYQTVRQPILSKHTEWNRDLFGVQDDDNDGQVDEDGVPLGFMQFSSQDQGKDTFPKTWRPFADHEHAWNEFLAPLPTSHEDEASAREAMIMLDQELHKKLPCKSRLCGGHGRALEHPARAIHGNSKPAYQIHHGRQKRTPKEQKNAFTIGSVIVHSARRALGTVANNWVYNKRFQKLGHRHAERSMGTHTFEQLFDNITEGFDDPVEAILLKGHDYLSDSFPFNMFRMATAENSVDHSEWLNSRVMTYNHLASDKNKVGPRYAHVELTPSEYKDITGEAWHDTRVTDEHIHYRRKMYKEHKARQEEEQEGGGRKRSVGGTGGRPAGVPISGPTVGGQAIGDFPLPEQADTDFDFEAPGLPLMQLLVQRNCYDEPHHFLCLPVIPMQWSCVFQAIVELIRNNDFPFNFCDSDEYCTRWFYYIERPPPAERFLVFLELANYIDLFISWERIANGFVWFFLAASFIAPGVKFFLEILRAAFPTILGPLLNWIIDLWPDTVDLRNDFPCLLEYIYDGFLVLILGILFILLVMPFIEWLLDAIQSVLDAFSTIEGINQSRKDTIENSMRYTFYHQAYQSEANAGLRFLNDPGYLDRNSLGLIPSYPTPVGESDPMNRMNWGRRKAQLERMELYPGTRADLYRRDITYGPSDMHRGGPNQRNMEGQWLLPGADNKNERMRATVPRLQSARDGDVEEAGEAPITYWQVPGSEETIDSRYIGATHDGNRGDDAPVLDHHEVEDPNVVDDDTYTALKELQGEIHDCLRLFGCPTERIDQADLNVFERHWGAFLHTFHTTVSWQRRAWGKLRHNRAKYLERAIDYEPYAKTVTYNRDRHVRKGGKE